MTDITIKIEAPELASAINALAAAFAGGARTSPVQPTEGAAEPEKPKRAPRATKTETPATSDTSSTPEAEATTSTEAAAAETASDPASDGSAPDGLVYEDVRGKVLELTAKRGREATVGLLAQFATGRVVFPGEALIFMLYLLWALFMLILGSSLRQKLGLDGLVTPLAGTRYAPGTQMTG